MSVPRLAAPALDALAFLLLACAAGIARAGGFVVDVLGLTVSFRTPSRTLLWFLIVVVIRVVVDRKTGPFGADVGRYFRQPGEDPFLRPWAPGLLKRVAMASLGLALLLALLLHDQLRQPYGVPDFGDPLFSIWRAGFTLHQLAIDPARLFDANIFYPARLTATFSDPTIASALLMAPLLAAGVHPVVAYNGALIGAFWLSGVATYLLVERMTGSPRAAFVAGLVYASYSYRFDHYSHLELQMTHWMPLGLLALHRFVATRRWVYAAALGLAGVLQLYSAMYYAVFFLVYIAAVGGVMAAQTGLDVRRVWKPVAVTILAAALAALPLARAFVEAQPLKGERPEEEVRYYSAGPSDYLRANTRSAIWHGRLLAAKPERALFPGATPLALGLAGALPPFGALHAIYGAGLLLSIDGTFGFNGASYPLLYRMSAAVRGLRVPARFAALVGLSLAIFAGLGAARILRRCRTAGRRHAVFAALVGFVVVDAWPDLTLRETWRQPPAIYAALEGRPDAVLAEFPVRDDEVFNIPYMYFSVWHWRPMVNGYSGFIPESYSDIEPRLLAFPDEQTFDALRDRGVTHVTYNCGLRYVNCREALRRLAEVDDLVLVTEATWRDRPARLYELRPH